MRLNLFLLGATLVLFISINASSTRSSSPVGNVVTSDQKDDIRAQRFLRDSAVTNEEERVLNPSGVDDAATFVKSMTSKVAEKSLFWTLRASGKSADDAFTFLRLHKAGQKPVSTSRYDAWLKYVATKPDTLSESIITTVAERYGEQGLMDLLEALVKGNAGEVVVDKVKSATMAIWKGEGKSASEVSTLVKPNMSDKYVKTQAVNVKAKVHGGRDQDTTESVRRTEGTKDVATRTQDGQVNTGVGTGRSADDAFTVLGLDKASKELSAGAKFKMWLEYVAMTPDTLSESMVTTVAERYGDKGLVDLLEALAKGDAGEVVVARVESATMAIWKGEGKSASEVSTLVKPNTSDKYVKTQAMTVKAEVHAGRDQDTTESVRKTKGTKDVLTKTQDGQVNTEVGTGKSADDAFAALRLDKSGEKLSVKAKFKMWLKYVAMTPDTLSESMVTTIAKRYGDKGLVDLFEALVKGNAGEVVVARVESATMAIWRGEGKTADEAFLRLWHLKHSELIKPTDHVLRQKLVNVWVKYVVFAALKPDVGVLQMIVEIDEKMLVMILEGFRNYEGTEYVVRRTQNILIWELVRHGKPADYVFGVLGLGKAGDSEANFKIWLKYVARKPDTLSESMVTTVAERYGDKGLVDLLEALAKPDAKEVVVARVESALMKILKDEKKSANEVFARLLELKQSELKQPTDHVLRQILLNVWVKYVRTAVSEPDVAVLQVTAGYDEKIRVMILEGLRHIEGTNDVVARIQDSLLRDWFRHQKSADDVFAALGLDKPSDKLSSEANFKMWLKYSAMKLNAFHGRGALRR